MTQAQSAAQKSGKWRGPEPGQEHGAEPARLENNAELAQKGNGPAGSRSRGKSRRSAPPPRKHSAKKRAAGFPAAHMEKDAVTPT